MNLPGFTADRSLYTSPQHYRTATTFGQASHVAAISPSLVLPAACDEQCHLDCLNALIPDCLEFNRPPGLCLLLARRTCNRGCGC